ncbi:uncharacterized protein KY384_003446 [Bacidia gigantensis]|uniref:uncharacterized protein n=1 Tax=Bacidia gigantensis TaxID=2732470 RepID=UPI001D05514C|nr:uncharacterized protein KY384_003446 [Bacidia gigantensis]KAG8531810.1 hypothetical protein KY384_003446 [Bacidia gigantensis]
MKYKPDPQFLPEHKHRRGIATSYLRATTKDYYQAPQQIPHSQQSVPLSGRSSTVEHTAQEPTYPPAVYNEKPADASEPRTTRRSRLSRFSLFPSRTKPEATEQPINEKSDEAPKKSDEAPKKIPKAKEDLGFFERQWIHFRGKYYQKGAPDLVFPSPPDDKEKYCYINMNRIPLMAWGVFSFFSLGAGMWLFLLATPVWAWYGLFAVLAQFYLVTSYGISCIGKSFKRDAHDEILRNNPVGPDAPTIDIYLPVCREPIEIIENTWKTIIQLQYPADKLKVWVLDDGAQTSIQDLAARYGFEYICRDDRPHLKKAGNMRWAYARTTGDFFTVFDADFCPRPDFLLETIPYHLADPKNAIVQTPQYFRSLKAQTWVEQGAGSVQEFFYRVVQTTRDTWGASICVGSNAVYRRESLVAVGGTAEIAFSEDVHTGYHAVDRGWKVKYVPVVLACGICPDTPRALFSQQMRWCRGSTTLLSNKEFYKSNLTKMQKFCYVTGFLYYSASAAAIFMNPLPGPLLLWVRPDYFKYYNLFFAIPSLVYGVIILRLWARSNYNLNVQFSNVIMYYAYVNSIFDRIRGNALNWAASGDAKAHKNNKYRNMRLLCWGWTITHNTALFVAVGYRLAKGFPYYQVIPLILLDLFNLYCSSSSSNSLSPNILHTESGVNLPDLSTSISRSFSSQSSKRDEATSQSTPSPTIAISGSSLSSSALPTTTQLSQLLIAPQIAPGGDSENRTNEHAVVADDGFVTANGTSNQDCSKSTTGFFTGGSGVLSLLDDKESIYSVDYGVPFAPFIPSRTKHAISSFWRMENNTLRWDNAAFLGGTARFCLSAGNNITAYFLIGLPEDCNAIQLQVKPGTMIDD